MQITILATYSFLAQVVPTVTKTVTPVVEPSPFNWASAATVLGVAALIIGAVVKIFHDEKKAKENPEVINHVNQLTTTVNLLNDKLNDHGVKISSLETDMKNVYREIEELKMLIRDIEKDNFNALGKVVDKVDSIKDLLINLKTKK